MTADWPGNVCKAASFTDSAVLLLIELIAGTAWLAPAMRHSLMSCLQLKALGEESELTALWEYMSAALQVPLQCSVLVYPLIQIHFVYHG
jgi:hypothetical protein